MNKITINTMVKPFYVEAIFQFVIDFIIFLLFAGHIFAISLQKTDKRILLLVVALVLYLLVIYFFHFRTAIRAYFDIKNNNVVLGKYEIVNIGKGFTDIRSKYGDDYISYFYHKSQKVSHMKITLKSCEGQSMNLISIMSENRFQYLNGKLIYEEGYKEFEISFLRTSKIFLSAYPTGYKVPSSKKKAKELQKAINYINENV